MLSSTAVHMGMHIIAATALCRSTYCRIYSSQCASYRQNVKRKNTVAEMMCMPTCTAVELTAIISEATWHQGNLFFFFFLLLCVLGQAASMQKLASACFSQT